MKKQADLDLHCFLRGYIRVQKGMNWGHQNYKNLKSTDVTRVQEFDRNVTVQIWISSLLEFLNVNESKLVQLVVSRDTRKGTI